MIGLLMIFNHSIWRGRYTTCLTYTLLKWFHVCWIWSFVGQLIFIIGELTNYMPRIVKIAVILKEVWYCKSIVEIFSSEVDSKKYYCPPSLILCPWGKIEKKEGWEEHCWPLPPMRDFFMRGRNILSRILSGAYSEGS